MSESTAKAVRRDLRRAMGDDGVKAVAESQRNIANLVHSLQNAHSQIQNAHSRIDQLFANQSRMGNELTDYYAWLVKLQGIEDRSWRGRIRRWLTR